MSHDTTRSVPPDPPTSHTDPEVDEVVAALQGEPARVSARWFYDAVGSALFEAITRLPEYYPTGCEIELLETHAPHIAKALPSGAALVELGSGSAKKVGRLLPELDMPRSYHPIDVSEAALEATASELAAIVPNLPIEALRADFTRPEQLGELLRRVAAQGPVVVFFPGSTIGNFDDAEAQSLLAGIGAALPEGTPMLLGVDLIKDATILEEAYDDPVGVTAAFNRNVLAHLNRRFGADFEPARWRHEAVWVPEERRVEMWLKSCGDQSVRVGDATLSFRDGDGIHTESCHKWDRARLEALAESSGWRWRQWWTDDRGWFAEALLTRAPAA